jgi:DNA-directed RNA polymerase subunit RPC12/RpoP
MQCPKCQTENREGVKFCEQCGAKMELECPHCGAKIPLGSKFCGECGQILEQPVEAEATVSSSKELPFSLILNNSGACKGGKLWLPKTIASK